MQDEAKQNSFHFADLTRNLSINFQLRKLFSPVRNHFEYFLTNQPTRQASADKEIFVVNISIGQFLEYLLKNSIGHFEIVQIKVTVSSDQVMFNF